MATLGSPSGTSPSRRRRKSFARKCERYCCLTLMYFPLSFVYGLSTWAVWVETRMACLQTGALAYISAFFGIALYILMNWSYTTAVFTDPGSPSSQTWGYTSLPTTEAQQYNSLTVKSSGETRFCKKCQCKKPDRAHHCSTCKRCVLKMDHHCPWLATCVGHKNYKPFLLFLIYTTFFCWVCFAVSAQWIWKAIILSNSVEDSLMPVNYILLSVLSGIMGLVVGGFTAWHVHLTLRGKTTIESLESTRYLNPIRAQVAPHLAQQRTYVTDEPHTFGEQMRHLGDQLIETHANALPGVLRPEEGQERSSPAEYSLRQTWGAAEEQRERERYMAYLDEQYNEKLPNAFDLGWRQNWRRVMGDVPWLWGVPVCNAMGDGWTWEVSSDWKEASERVRQRKEEEMQRSGLAVPMGNDAQPPQMHNPNATLPQQRSGSRQGMRQENWKTSEQRSGTSTPLRDMGTDEGGYDTSSDEEMLADTRARLLRQKQGENWNDLPEEMLRGGSGSGRSRPPGKRKDR